MGAGGWFTVVGGCRDDVSYSVEQHLTAPPAPHSTRYVT